jgi:hypothetical protein
MFREEITRAFWNRTFILSVLLAFLALGQGLTDYLLPNDPEYLKLLPPNFNNAYDAVIWAQNGLLGLVAPLLVVIPFSDSLSLDRVSGYLRFVLLRTSYKKYFLAKATTCALAGGSILALATFLFFIFTNLVFPRGLNLDPLQSRVITRPDALGPFGSLYQTTPDAYIWSLIGLSFIFGATYAVFGLAIATLSDNRYVPLATPFLVFLLAHFVTSVFSLPNWSPLSALIPHWVLYIRWPHIGVSLVLVWFVSGLLFGVGWLRTRDR